MPAWLKTILKWSGFFILAVVLLGSGVFVAAYAVNAHDQELSAEAKALLVASPTRLAPEDNLYFSLAGLTAPSGASTTAAGIAISGRYERASAFTLSVPEQKRLLAEDPDALRFSGDTQFCRMREGSVWADAAAHEAQVARLRSDNAELYARYLALPQARGFHAAIEGSVQAPFWLGAGLRCLFLSDVALRLRSESPAARTAALGILVRDLLVWRTMLTGEGDLISKMLPLAYLHADYLVLADALADPAFALPEAADADAVAPLFELSAWDIRGVFPIEMRVYMKAVASFAQQGELSSRFYKTNASANLHAARLAELMKLAAPDPKNYAALAALDEGTPRRAWRHLYNPIGQMLESMGPPTLTWSDYLLRAWDGAAMQRLVRLGFEIRRQNIGPDAIAAFMQAHPELATHPGDGRAFEYDTGRHELRMHPLSRQARDSGRRYAIPLWHGPAV